MDKMICLKDKGEWKRMPLPQAKIKSMMVSHRAYQMIHKIAEFEGIGDDEALDNLLDELVDYRETLELKDWESRQHGIN